MIEIQIARTQVQLKKLSKLALKHQLYQNKDWSMYREYITISNIVGLGILSHNFIPVCACMLVNQWYSIGTYTVFNYRRMGFAKSLVRAMHDEFTGHPKRWAVGIPGSEVFYKKVLENER